MCCTNLLDWPRLDAAACPCSERNYGPIGSESTPPGRFGRVDPAAAWHTSGVVRRPRLEELRTTLTGVDPGLVRLRLGGIAAASMILAVLGSGPRCWCAAGPFPSTRGAPWTG